MSQKFKKRFNMKNKIENERKNNRNHQTQKIHNDTKIPEKG